VALRRNPKRRPKKGKRRILSRHLNLKWKKVVQVHPLGAAAAAVTQVHHLEVAPQERIHLVGKKMTLKSPKQRLWHRTGQEGT